MAIAATDSAQNAGSVHIRIAPPKPVSAPKPQAPPKAPTAKFTVPNVHDTVKAIAPGSPAVQSPNQFAASQSAKTASSYQQYVGYLNSDMGRVNPAMLQQVAQGEIASSISPLLQGLQAEGVAGDQAITGYTKQLAGNLAGITPQIQGAYSQAEQQQSALDTAIAAELQGNGGQQAAALQASLANAGQSTAPAAAAAQSAQGIAGAQYATGSASLAQLLAQGAANTAYGAKMPGIAALAGEQAIGSLQQSLASQANTGITEAEKQFPTIYNDLAKTASTAQYNNARLAQGNQKNLITAQNNATRNRIAEQNATTSREKANTQAASLKTINQIKSVLATNTVNKTNAQITQGAQKIAQAGQKLANEHWYQSGELAAKSASNAIAASKAATASMSASERVRHDKAMEQAALARVAVSEQKAKQGGSTSTSVSYIKNLQSKVPQWASGRHGTEHWDTNANNGKGGFVEAPNGTPAMNYQTAMTQAMAGVKSLPAAQQAAAAQAAMAIVNNNFPENGQNGRQFTGQSAIVAAASFATQKLRQGESAQKALTDMTAWGYVDQAVARAAIQKVYSQGAKSFYNSNAPRVRVSAKGVSAGNKLAAGTLAGAK